MMTSEEQKRRLVGEMLGLLVCRANRLALAELDYVVSRLSLADRCKLVAHEMRQAGL